MKKLFLSFAAAAALVSCAQKSEVADLSLVREVSIVANAADTKTLLDGNNVVWENGDAIRLRFAKDPQYHFENFATTGTGTSATFTGSLPNDVSTSNGYDATGYAVYPADAMANDGTVSFTLPATVTALESGSFASGTNLSSAIVSLQNLNNSGTTSATFKNAFAIVRFTLDANVKSVKITADGNIAGEAVMNFDGEGRLVAGSWTNGSSSLVISPEGTTFTSSKVYNVLVYPGTYKSLSVLLTDVDNCTYEKTITGTYDLQASNYYTFNFNTQFVKEYTFTAGWPSAVAVYKSGSTVLHEKILTPSNGKFTDNLPASVAHGSNITGFAMYPTNAYNMSTDKVTYNIPLNGAGAEDLYYGSLTGFPESISTVKNFATSLAQLQFTLPAGIKTVAISSTKPLVGTAELTMDANENFVAGTASDATITVTPDMAAGTYTCKVYPVAGANLTFTLTDAAGQSVTQTFNNVTFTAGQTETLTISGDISFDKNGNFDNENFTSGGSYEF